LKYKREKDNTVVLLIVGVGLLLFVSWISLTVIIGTYRMMMFGDVNALQYDLITIAQDPMTII